MHADNSNTLCSNTVDPRYDVVAPMQLHSKEGLMVTSFH